MNKCEDCKWYLLGFEACQLQEDEDCENFEELLIDPNDYVSLSLEEDCF